MDEELERFRRVVGFSDEGSIESSGDGDDSGIHWSEVIYILAGGRTEEAERLKHLPVMETMKLIIVQAKHNQRLAKAAQPKTNNDLEYLRDYLT
ncbi:MAG: hypothetical protein H3C35_03720 [Bacteroidetes bacterium]|nr:hypothetical protein [Bacteroidota bacterium]